MATKKRAGQAASAVVATGAAALKIGAAINPALGVPAGVAALGQGAVALWQIIGGERERRTNERFGFFYEELLREHPSGKSFEAEVVAMLDGSEAERTFRAIEDSIRAALDAFIPEVARHLALLSRQYVRRANPQPDRFFRGVARLLMEFEAEDLPLARAIVGRANMFLLAHESVTTLRLSYQTATSAERELVVESAAYAATGGPRGVASTPEAAIKGAAVPRMLRRFEAEQLFRDGVLTIAEGPSYLADTVVVRQLAEILCPTWD